MQDFAHYASLNPLTDDNRTPEVEASYFLNPGIRFHVAESNEVPEY
jgi:hypothetical protein